MDLTFQGSYAILLFTALDLASITSHIHNWVLFLLWLHPFILSGVTSLLISSSVLGTYWPGEFLFQYPIILPFHTVHGVLKARILKWLAIPFSSGPRSVRFKGLDLIDRVPDELWNEVHDIVQETGIKTIPMKKKCKKNPKKPIS